MGSMKRFLLFKYQSYYPKGGINDFVQDFDTLKEAKNFSDKMEKGNDEWVDIYDGLKKKKISSIRTQKMKDVKGFEGIYKISPCGKIFSLRSNKFLVTYKEKTVSGSYYEKITLFKDKVRYPTKIHRLVAEHFIPKISGKTYVDHINGNSLDNSVENLRWCTPSENCMNKGKLLKFSSVYKGVHKIKKNKWGATLRFNGKAINLGTFYDEVEAAKAYDKKAFELFPGIAKLNF